jgi:hypothetical protein
VPAGKVVEEDFYVNYTIGNAKRNIQLIRRDLLPQVINDMKEIMRYTPNSNYISKTLKKTEPIRITGK